MVLMEIVKSNSLCRTKSPFPRQKERESERVDRAFVGRVIISFKTKTSVSCGHGDRENCPKLSRVLSKKKRAARCWVSGAMQNDAAAAKRRKEEVLSALRTCELTGVHPRYPARRFSFCGAGAHLFSSLCAIAGAILTPGRTHYFPSVPLCETFFHI